MDQPYVTGFSRYQPDTGSPTQKVERPSQRTFDLVWQVLGSNQRRRCRQIYSLLPLATRATCHATSTPSRGVGNDRKQ